jgi:parvulin-like peptidyl-prolyl isomerase
MNRQTFRVMLRTVLGLALLVPASCRQEPQAGGAGTPRDREPAGVMALVNGVPVTEADVRAEFHSKTAGVEPTPEQKKVLLDRVIGKELLAQKAAEQGLGDEAYREELARRTADLNAWKRQALSDAFFRNQAAQEPPIGDEEARRYYDEHAAAIRTETHVWQILARDEAQIVQVQQELASGASFEDVARKRFPDLPEGRKPWDLGYLKWKQIPAAWQDALSTLKPGDTSDVLRGTGGRIWIIRLIDRREAEGMDFEQVKPVIVDDLKNLRMEQTRATAADELRKSARIEYRKPAASHP